MQIRKKVHKAIQEVFKVGGAGLERRYFPEGPDDIPDTPALRLVVLAPEHSWEPDQQEETRTLLQRILWEYAGRGRTYKSGLIFMIADTGAQLQNEVRTLLALESLADPAEQERLRLEPSQIREIEERKRLTEQKLPQLVWQAHHRALLLENSLRELDLGRINPSMSRSLADLLLDRLRQEGLLEGAIHPDYLVRHCPPAHREGGWSTRALREMFYASPSHPRLLDPAVLRHTIARGVQEGKFAYEIRSEGGPKKRIFQDPTFTAEQVEFPEEVLLVLPDQLSASQSPPSESPESREAAYLPAASYSEAAPLATSGNPSAVLPKQAVRWIVWEGKLPWQQWSDFYLQILTHFSQESSLEIVLRFTVAPERGFSEEKLEEIRSAFRMLGLNTDALQVGTEIL